MTAPGDFDEAPDQRFVIEPGGSRGFSEAGVRAQVAVRVDLDDVRRAIGGYAYVYAAVVAQLEGFEGVAGHGAGVLESLLGQPAGHGQRRVVLGRRLVPFRGIGDDARVPRFETGEVDLVDGQNLGRGAEEGHVELVPVDEPLDERRLRAFHQDALARPGELSPIGDDRAVIDPDGSILVGRFDDSRERDVDAVQILSPLHDGPFGRGDAPRSKQLLRLGLVEGERERQGTGAGIRGAEQVEERRDDHLAAGVTGEGLTEVDDEIGVVGGERGVEREGVLTEGVAGDGRTASAQRLLEGGHGAQNRVLAVARDARGQVLEVVVEEDGDAHERATVQQDEV